MNKRLSIPVFILFVLLTACTRESYDMFREEDDMGKVPVALKLDVVPLVEGVLAETKTTMDPDLIDDPNLDEDEISDMQIHDFTILQFDGVTGDAVLKSGGISYYDHWPLHGYDTLDPEYDEDDVVKLSASATPNTIVVLANTYEDPLNAILEGMTLSDFLAADFSTISSLSDVFTTIGGDNYLRMSGSVCTAIGSSTTIVVPLKRNVAKVVINLNNTSSGDNVVSLSTVQLKSINDKYYYLAHVADVLESATPSASFIDPYSAIAPHRFDDDVQAFPSAKNTSGEVETYTFYVPANLRGEPTENLLQYNKGKYAPAGATYFRIFGKYPHETDYTAIDYTYYLGGDLTKNFDIRPNYKYTYDITITGRGDSRYDYRIDDMSEKVFYTDANCYMLHPPQASGQSRVYAFPVRRAAVFWNSEGVNQGVYGASNMSGYEDLAMGANTPWTAEVVWSDFDMSEYMITDPEDPAYKDRFLQVASGTGFDPENPSHSQPYIKVKVHNGMEGNVVVAVKKGDVVLWSWHLWITDYDPDVYATPVEGTYIYEAINGQIHRINNDLWKTKASENKVGYADGFIMDRNLGSFSPAYSNRRGLYYQYGRKDPFNIVNQFYYGGITSSTSLTTIHYQSTGVEGDFNIRYSVNNPAVFIKGYVWTSADDDLGDGGSTFSDRRWQDRKFLEHKGHQTVLEIKKSIYDPCPPGWAVPECGSFSGFTMSGSDNIMSGTYTTVWEDHGRYYYPEGYKNAALTGIAGFYPAEGFRHNETGGLTHPGGMGVMGRTAYYWYNGGAVSSSRWGSIVYFYENYMAASFGNYNNPSYGFPVRCVRE